MGTQTGDNVMEVVEVVEVMEAKPVRALRGGNEQVRVLSPIPSVTLPSCRVLCRVSSTSRPSISTSSCRVSSAAYDAGPGCAGWRGEVGGVTLR